MRIRNESCTYLGYVSVTVTVYYLTLSYITETGEKTANINAKT